MGRNASTIELSASEREYLELQTRARTIQAQLFSKKAAAAVVYCRAVTDWNNENGGKPWVYALIPHDEVRLNSSFSYLMNNRATYHQMGLDEI